MIVQRVVVQTKGGQEGRGPNEGHSQRGSEGRVWGPNEGHSQRGSEGRVRGPNEGHSQWGSEGRGPNEGCSQWGSGSKQGLFTGSNSRDGGSGSKRGLFAGVRITGVQMRAVHSRGQGCRGPNEGCSRVHNSISLLEIMLYKTHCLEYVVYIISSNIFA